MSEKNRCTVCGETLELNGLNKLVQDLTGGLAGLSGIFTGHWNEENYSHSEIDEHVDDDTIHFEQIQIHHGNLIAIGVNTHDEIDTHLSTDVIKSASDVQGISIGGDFSGTIGNIQHGSIQKCNITGLTTFNKRSTAPTTWDFSLTSGSWYSLDISSIVPANTIAVEIEILYTSGTTDNYIAVSGTNNNNFDGIKINTIVASKPIYGRGIIDLRTTQTLYYYCGSCTEAKLTIHHWWA